MRRFDLIIFDNDGVLVDTEGYYFQANRETLARFHVALDREAYIQLFLRDSRGARSRARTSPSCHRRATSSTQATGSGSTSPRRTGHAST